MREVRAETRFGAPSRRRDRIKSRDPAWE